jgi:threonine/homoserine/homoserine lactone efflux protein
MKDWGWFFITISIICGISAFVWRGIPWLFGYVIFFGVASLIYGIVLLWRQRGPKKRNGTKDDN